MLSGIFMFYKLNYSIYSILISNIIVALTFLVLVVLRKLILTKKIKK